MRGASPGEDTGWDALEPLATTSMPQTIRRATQEDAPGICQVHVLAIRVLCRDHYSPSEIESWAGSKTPSAYRDVLVTRAMFVAENDGKVVGFAQLHLEGATVEAVYVSPDVARCGVGSALLTKLESVAAEHGVRELVLKSTLNAEPFYLRHGYEILAASTHGDLSCTLMRKSLDGVPVA